MRNPSSQDVTDPQADREVYATPAVAWKSAGNAPVPQGATAPVDHRRRPVIRDMTIASAGHIHTQTGQ